LREGEPSLSTAAQLGDINRQVLQATASWYQSAYGELSNEFIDRLLRFPTPTKRSCIEEYQTLHQTTVDAFLSHVSKHKSVVVV